MRRSGARLGRAPSSSGVIKRGAGAESFAAAGGRVQAASVDSTNTTARTDFCTAIRGAIGAWPNISHLHMFRPGEDSRASCFPPARPSRQTRRDVVDGELVFSVSRKHSRFLDCLCPRASPLLRPHLPAQPELIRRKIRPEPKRSVVGCWRKGVVPIIDWSWVIAADSISQRGSRSALKQTRSPLSAETVYTAMMISDDDTAQDNSLSNRYSLWSRGLP